MDAREQRGMQIAATINLRKKGAAWVVPSQTGNGVYAVNVNGSQPTCSCPDHEIRGVKCKHIYAVEFSIRRETRPDNTTTVTKTVRVTYSQDWPAYNEAQVNEKRQFQALLSDLCHSAECMALPDKVGKNGRPRLALSDAVFAVTFKVYSTFSGRRFITDLCEAQSSGYISQVPHFNSIFNYLQKESLTPILQALIVRSSLPLKSVETDFACDSTGFMTSRFIRWFDVKYNGFRQQHEWVKTHIMCGVKTNVVTAVEIYDKSTQESPLMPSLVETTARNFTIKEVSADKGFSSISNVEMVARYGATPFIAYKSGHTGKGGGVWEKMFHFFNFKRDEFLAHYHKRSNIESTVSMIKAKFSDHVRSKTETAMKNEVLCKVLCHNICCLISAIYELEINPLFGDSEQPTLLAQKPHALHKMSSTA